LALLAQKVRLSDLGQINLTTLSTLSQGIILVKCKIWTKFT